MNKGKNSETMRRENELQTNETSGRHGLTRGEAVSTPWLGSPTDFMQRFRNETDRLLENFGFGSLTRGWPTPVLTGRSIWSPQVEIAEREGQLVIRADLPGLTRDDVKVDLSDDAITIEGERKQEHEETGEGFYRSERSYGGFYRSIPLPEGVNVDTAKASFRNGVLEITMEAPERTKRKARRIEILDEGASSPRARAAGGSR